MDLSDQPVNLYRYTTIANCELIEAQNLQNISESSFKPEQVFRVTSTPEDIPEHLKDLLQSSIVHLNKEQQDKVLHLLLKYQSVFSKSKSDLGKTDIVKHKIDTADAAPIKMQPRRLPLAKRQEAEKEIKRLLDDGIIEPSNGPWASPIVLVRKKDGSTRLCIDYRRVNSITKKDSYPLPLINDSLDTLGGATWFSSTDLLSGYYQVQMELCDKEKTAFTSHEGLYQFKVLGFGLCNAVATFQRPMEYVLRGLHWKTCLLYIDDIIVFADDFESHVQRLGEVLDRIARTGLKISPKKCNLFQKKVQFLGHIVSSEGIATDPEKVECVKNWPPLKSVHQVRSFLGTCSYYRRHNSSFSDIARPLNKLTEKGAEFIWTDECENAFQTLKEKLTFKIQHYTGGGENFNVLDMIFNSLIMCGNCKEAALYYCMNIRYHSYSVLQWISCD